MVSTEWAAAMVATLMTNLPFLWFVISLAFWAILAFGLYKLFRHYNYQSQGVTIVRLKVSGRVHA